jgi:CDP-glycerol glycerophosphotransferase (TagB/SpsB family)
VHPNGDASAEAASAPINWYPCRDDDERERQPIPLSRMARDFSWASRMKAMLWKLTSLIHRFAPRMNHVVIWGWPDGEDSVIALEQALQKARVRRVVLLTSNPVERATWKTGAKTIRLRKNSPRGWVWFCFARYVFFTHPCFTKQFPRDVVSVNVWHGMPIKKIGLLLDNDEPIDSSHALATSPFWGEIMRRTISPDSRVLAVGLPRNDRLFCDRSEVMAKLGIPADKRLLAWLPTYRKSARGLSRMDGTDAGNAFAMPDLDPEEFNRFLRARNVVAVVKPHPMSAASGPRTFSNLLIVDDAWLRERRVSLYEFLGATDLLVSDISSVVIDYLLLDRPIIHAFADLDVYASSRGFTVEPIADYFAGPVVGNAWELFQALDSALAGEDVTAVRRRKLLGLSHTYRDGRAAERLLDALELRR